MQLFIVYVHVVDFIYIDDICVTISMKKMKFQCLPIYAVAKCALYNLKTICLPSAICS